MTNTKIIQASTAIPPQRDSLPLWHSPPSNALDSYFNSPQRHISPPPLGWCCPVECLGVIQINESEWLEENEAKPYSLWYPDYTSPAHFLSWVAGSGDIIHLPDYSPHHKRSKLHDPCIPRLWAMGCPAWTLAEPSHNKVIYISDHADHGSVNARHVIHHMIMCRIMSHHKIHINKHTRTHPRAFNILRCIQNHWLWN